MRFPPFTLVAARVSLSCARCEASARLALVGGLLGSPVIVTFAKKYGKAKMQGYLLLAWGVIYIVFCIIPTSVYQASSIIIYIVGFFLGVGQTLAFLLTDSILCDIIDYDELYAPRTSSLVLPPSPHRPPFPLACLFCSAGTPDSATKECTP